MDRRASKYILYALGEILLVVVGILIVLQVNNWNAERNERLVEEGLIEELQEALVRDLEILDSEASCRYGLGTHLGVGLHAQASSSCVVGLALSDDGCGVWY